MRTSEDRYTDSLTSVCNIVKQKPHIRKFSENNRECWARIGEQEMCGLVYSYILRIRYYAPNRFSVLPNFRKKQILANTIRESQFSRLLINLCDNARECYEYSMFNYSRPFSENWCMYGSALTSACTSQCQYFAIASKEYFASRLRIPVTCVDAQVCSNFHGMVQCYRQMLHTTYATVFFTL